MAAPLSVEVEFGRLPGCLSLWPSFAEAVRSSCLTARNIRSPCPDRTNPGTSGTSLSGSRRTCSKSGQSCSSRETACGQGFWC
uniref:Ubiquitin related modifier 1 n=2 Tax=Sus scrofa TaxID=9823 RepID=A0A8D1KM78_PIG